MAKIEMHTHSTASDGRLEPGELVALAARNGLTAIALTDHDTLGGLAVAEDAAQQIGIRLITGVEVSCSIDGHEVHLLGYFLDPTEPHLQTWLELRRQERVVRAERMVELIERSGQPITWQQVRSLAGTGTVGRPHIARALMDVGAVSTMQEAFELFLQKGTPTYVPRPRVDPADAIKRLHDAGAAVVWAHPGLTRKDDLLPLLVDMGLDGLEAEYPLHSIEQRSHYRRLAKKYDLLVSAGSDYHGPGTGRAELADCSLTELELQILEQRARHHQKDATWGSTKETEI